MRKYISFLLSICMVLSCFGSATSVYATEVPVTTSESSEPQIDAKTYFDLAVRLIMSKYKFDVNREEIYRATLEKLLEEKPELLEELFKDYALS